MRELGFALPDERPFDVVGVGLNAIDHLCTVPAFPTFNSKQQMAGYACQPGGQVATAMVALQRWGCRTSYIGTFGDGIIGELSRRSLAEEHVDVSGAVQRRGVANQMAVILVDQASGERTVLMHRPPALVLQPDEVRHDLVTAGRVLHVDGYDLDAALTAAAWAHEAGMPVVVDLDTRVGAVERLVAISDAVIVSQEFAEQFTGIVEPARAIERLAAATDAPLVAITLGDAGVIARSRLGIVTVPAYAVRCVDSTGAGDVFHAGFIYGLLRDWPLERALRFANAAAALKCTQVGGRSGIPTVAAAEELATRPVHNESV
jgi:sugar/nucleoside kinase (ribokinase family)